MDRRNIKNLGIIFLIMWCLFGTVSPFSNLDALRDLYGFSITFIIMLLPFQIMLFLLSRFSAKNFKGNYSRVALAGFYTSIVTFFVNVLVIIWNLVR